jgi:NAD(P)-dependent dehydrogenase (short-subunit alcohol dehydrogenase family)
MAGRVVLITGRGGIGLATVLGLAALGARMATAAPCTLWCPWRARGGTEEYG